MAAAVGLRRAESGGGAGGEGSDVGELVLRDLHNPDPKIPRHITLGQAVTRLGRIVHPDFADIAVESTKCSAQVSRKHATVRRNNGRWTITDEHSTNGILVNGKQITPELPFDIQHGDLVTFGNDESDLVYTFVTKFIAGKKDRNDLKQLEVAHKAGFLNDAQYRERAKGIHDRLQRELVLDASMTPKSTRSIPGITQDWVRSHNIERAFKFVFNWKEKRWEKCLTLLVVENTAFEAGAMRECFRATDLTKPPGQQEVVVKRSKEAGEPQQQYFADAEMQALCQFFAEIFCSNNPPKPVRFVEATVIEFFERPGKPIFACEPFLTGQYKKHSNNYGYVAPEDRNTPHAFSHFTYQCSGGRYLVCDIQGVNDALGDVYTDPQVHSREDMGPLFGKGNLGQKGILQFFHTHECNYICEMLGIDSGRKRKKHDRGTCPPQLFANNAKAFELSEEDMKKYRLTRQQTEQLAEKFRRLAKDSGGMDKKEFVELCKQLGADLNPHQIDHAMRFVDRDGSGLVSFQEFVMWWVGASG